MDKQQLQDVRQWAKDKIAGGQEPPWAWYQYMKLVESLDSILAGMGATTALPEPRLKLVGAEDAACEPAAISVTMPI